jgi:hypothetical protein
VPPCRGVDDQDVNGEPCPAGFAGELSRRVFLRALHPGGEPARDMAVEFGDEQDGVVPGLRDGVPERFGQAVWLGSLEVLGVEIGVVGCRAGPHARHAGAAAGTGGPDSKRHCADDTACRCFVPFAEGTLVPVSGA